MRSRSSRRSPEGTAGFRRWSEGRGGRDGGDGAGALRFPVLVQRALDLRDVDERADVGHEKPQSAETAHGRVLVALGAVHPADVLAELEVAEDDEARQQADDAAHTLA